MLLQIILEVYNDVSYLFDIIQRWDVLRYKALHFLNGKLHNSHLSNVSTLFQLILISITPYFTDAIAIALIISIVY